MSPLIVSDDEVGGKSPTEAEYHSSILNIVTCIECLLSWHGWWCLSNANPCRCLFLLPPSIGSSCLIFLSVFSLGWGHQRQRKNRLREAKRKQRQRRSHRRSQKWKARRRQRNVNPKVPKVKGRLKSRASPRAQARKTKRMQMESARRVRRHAQRQKPREKAKSWRLTQAMSTAACTTHAFAKGSARTRPGGVVLTVTLDLSLRVSPLCT